MHLHNHILLKNIFTKDKGLKPITTNAQQIPKCTNPQVPVKAHLSPVSSELPFHSAACNNPLIITHLKKKTILKHWIQPFVPLSSLLVRGCFYISPPSSRGALSRSFVLGNQSHPVTTINILENSASGAGGTQSLEACRCLYSLPPWPDFSTHLWF